MYASASILCVGSDSAGSLEPSMLDNHVCENPMYRLKPFYFLQVTVEMYLIALNDVDEVEQKIQITAYLKVVWSDHFLSWTPASYNNIDKITVKQDRVWKPDLALANAYDTVSGLGDSFMYLTITHLGEVSWYPYQIFDSSCTLDMTNFPFDSQSCDIQLVTWSSTKEMINIVSGTDGFDTTFFETNANWDLLSVSTADSSTSTTAGLSFNLKIRRKPFFFLLNFIIPIVCLSILNLFVFVLPCESGEKTSYAIVLFLSFAIFLLIVTEIMPEGMNTVPVMSTYLLIQCVMSTIIVFVTIIQLRLHNQGDVTPVPHFLKSFVGIVFALKRKLCLEKHYEEEERQREEEIENETPFQVVKQNGGGKLSSGLSDSPKLSTAKMNGASGYFWRKKRVSPEHLPSDPSQTINSIEMEEQSISTPTELVKTSRKTGDPNTLQGRENNQLFKPGRTNTVDNQHSNAHNREIEIVPESSRIDKKSNSTGRNDYNTRTVPSNRIRLQHRGASNGAATTEKMAYQFDLDSTDVKQLVDEDTRSELSVNDEDVSWTDVATAMDVVFFMVFFICNLITTTIAFLLTAMGGNYI